MMKLCLLFSFVGCGFASYGWNDGDDRVHLKDVGTLTLYHGKRTASRRSSPVSQLQCVGGSAGCNAFVPQVVQCYNRGYDGSTAHWECKADMDNAYRFGSVEVTCEGYDHPGDKYVLRGSCGLEYTLDHTGSGSDGSYYTNNQPYYKQRSSGFAAHDIILLIVVALVIYIIYKTCVSQNQYSTLNSDYPDYPSSDQSHGYRSGGYGFGGAAPPPGFRDDYGGDSCGRHRQAGASPFGGFWTGAGLGGLFGYMMGNRGNRHHYYNDYSTGYQRPFGGSSWGSSGGRSYSSGSSSSGTRTASGFGTTRTR